MDITYKKVYWSAVYVPPVSSNDGQKPKGVPTVIETVAINPFIFFYVIFFNPGTIFRL